MDDGQGLRMYSELADWFREGLRFIEETFLSDTAPVTGTAESAS